MPRVDFVERPDGSGFHGQQPDAVASCGCGSELQEAEAARATRSPRPPAAGCNTCSACDGPRRETRQLADAVASLAPAPSANPLACPHMSEHPVVDVTIIGAGPAGLAAAYYAGHREASCRIIESLEQLGGQVAAVYPEKHIFDIAGLPEDQRAGVRRPHGRAGAAVRRRGAARRGGRDARARQGRRRGAVGHHDRQGRPVPHAHGHHHGRARRVRAAHAADRGPRGVARPRPPLLRQAQGRLRGQALRDRGRRRLRARLDDQPAGHRRRADPRRPPARPLPRPGVVADRGARARRGRRGGTAHALRGARAARRRRLERVTIEDTASGESSRSTATR